MPEVLCSFRRDVQTSGSSESAVCGFIQQLTEIGDEFCRVDRSACEVCVQHSPFAPPQMNPVMPSLMLSACEQASAVSQPGPSATTMHSWAASVVEAQSVPCLVPQVTACDVVLMVADPAADITATVESVFLQENMFPVLHLVADGHAANAVVDKYTNRAGLRIHRFDAPIGLWNALHHLMPMFRTPWIAVQSADTISRPQRLHTSIEQLQDDAGDLFAAEVTAENTEFSSQMPTDDQYSAAVQHATLVFRRASLVDAGGFDLTRTDADQEFVHRLHCEGRTICISDESVATSHRSAASDVSETPAYLRRSQELRQTFESRSQPNDSANVKLRATWEHPRLAHFGSGFPSSNPATCDVVLPFRDDFHFVREAMQGLLNQVDAEIIIHLIDDDSQGDSAALLDEYRHLANVRIYQNERNLGPFATFNNISEFAETPFIAVQDADDISLPRRISTLVRLLQTSSADIAASATELFGQPALIPQVAHTRVHSDDGENRFLRESRYPCRRGRGYFLENPTLTMRVDAFRRLGGYADYGESRRSRTGVDTEFQQRAYFAHAHIAVSRDVLLKYRCHGSSATNDSTSGFGSQAQLESQAETRRRFLHYATGSFDPRCFGSLGQHFGITRRR